VTYLSLDISVPRKAGKVWCRRKEIRSSITRLPSIQTPLNILQDEKDQLNSKKGMKKDNEAGIKEADWTKRKEMGCWRRPYLEHNP
jgi:asparagine synthetase B (glutamine-hydrolysing)